MFLSQARNFITTSTLLYRKTGKNSRFRPGQALHPSSHFFIREKVQPVVQGTIYNFEDYLIRMFNFLNNTFFTTFAQLFQWLGVWNLLSYYVWPWDNTTLRDGIYFSIGMLMTALSVRYLNLDIAYDVMAKSWDTGIPDNFGWSRKAKSFLRKTFNFFGYGFMWVGAWDYIDSILVPEDVVRDSLYVAIPVFLGFLFEELISVESLYYFAARMGQRNNSPKIENSKNSGGCCSTKSGIPLSPSYDSFIRNLIQPAVEEFVSPCMDWTIAIFTFINSLFFITVISLFQWIGMWDCFSYYVWQYDESTYRYRDLLYCCVGFIGMIISDRFFNMEKSYEDMEDQWHQGLPTNFGFIRKIIEYSRETFNFLGFLFVWVGAWDFLDTQIWPSTWLREVLYLAITIPVSFLLEEVLSADSLYYIAAKRRGGDLNVNMVDENGGDKDNENEGMRKGYKRILPFNFK